MKKLKLYLARTSRLAVATSLTSLVVFGQGTAPGGQTQSTKGAVIKGKAPVSKDILRVKLPKAQEFKLSNGLKVLLLENMKLPSFSMQLVVLSGGMSDAPDAVGAAQFTSSLLREGTKTRSSKQLAEQIDSVGGTLNSNAGLSTVTSVVNSSGLTDNLDQILELFADVILNPSFPEDEFNKLKTRTLANLRAQRSNPGFLAAEKFSSVIYGDHPAGRLSLKAQDFDRLSPAVLQKFHAAYYRPNNAMLTIVGHVTAAEITPKLEKAFGSWRPGEVAATTIPKTGAVGPSKIYLIHRPGSVQTNLRAGNQSLERTDPDYPAVQVMNLILGGGGSARLFLNLREDKGYTYGAYSSVTAAKYRGAFQATTDVRTEVTDGSMKELLYELKRIRDERVLDKDLENAKRQIIGGFALQLESPQALISNIVTQKVYNLPADYWDTYPQMIAAVTAADVQRVASKYIDIDHLQVVAVGDAQKIGDVLRKYGTVETLDTDGKPLGTAIPDTRGTTATGAGANIVGIWNLTAKGPNGERPLKVSIKYDGKQIGGTLETPVGEFPIVGGSLNGGDITFKVKAEIQGNATELDFTGKVDGDQIKGQMSSTSFPAFDFTGKKEK